MLDLPAALKVFQEVSRIEGNLGWLTAIGSGGGMFVPLMERHHAEKLFSDPKAVLAGSGYPKGVAKKAEGGYIVEGEWKYCSGAPFASFFTANSVKENGEISSFIFMPGQVEVVPDWNAFGLRGTGSHSIRVNGAFVPEDRTFSLMGMKNEYGKDVHTFPFIPFSQATFSSVCFGIATHFLQEARHMALARANSGQERFQSVLDSIEDKEKNLCRNITAFYAEIESLWDDHVSKLSLTEEQMEQFGQMCKTSVEETFQGVNSLIRHLGMDAIMESSALNKIWRDLYTAGQHAFITP